MYSGLVCVCLCVLILAWSIKGTLSWSGHVNVTDIRLKPTANQIARRGNWKLLAQQGNPIELYNLKEDPYERWNLMKQYPEIATQLTNELTLWLNEPRQKLPYK